MNHQDIDLTILSIAINQDRNTVKPVVEQNGLTFPVLLDPESQVARQYQIRGIPTTFFIDRDGIIQDIKIGPMSEEQIEQYVRMAW